MINIDRPTEVPESLQRPEIQRYLDALQAHLESIREGIDSSTPSIPESYRTSELLKKFESVFFSKCWLTEKKFEVGSDLEVDHFETRNEAPHLLYAWTNLLPVDSSTNKIRPKSTPPGGYLNPCNPNHDVENEILYILLPEHETIFFEAADPTNQAALNTADLLNRVHNGHNATTRESTEGLRRLIFKREAEILRHYRKYTMLNEGTLEKRIIGAMLKYFFSRESSFTMLLRNSETGQDLKEFHQD